MSSHMRMGFLGLALAIPANVLAIETSTVGTGQAAQASVDAVNVKLDSTLAAMKALIDKMNACNAARKFYAPADARKDGNGCVGLQDYDFNMNNNSMVNATGTRSNEFVGRFINNGTGTDYPHGVVGQSRGNGYGVYGLSATSWGGVFDGGTTAYGALGQGVYGVYGINTGGGGYGVYGTTTTTNGWAGVFNSGASPNGVAIDNNAHNASFCLNGSCVTNMSSIGGGNGIKWGGSYFYGNYGCMSVNAFTGGCSCPSGYSQFGGMSGTSGGYIFYLYECYKGSWNGT